jgi:1,4-alpha-glucan branching enzyme
MPGSRATRPGDIVTSAAGLSVEILNTDAEEYGGSGVGNLGEIHAQNVEWQGRPASARIGVPPLATVWFRYDG